jgi:hypothetical protein
VRRAERRPRDERVLTVHETRDRMNPRHLERRSGFEHRQDPRQAAREHRLPRPRRAAEEDVVAARRRQLERPPGPFLPANVGEIGSAGRALAVRRQRRLGVELELAAQVRDGLGEMPDGNSGDACERSLPSRVGRAKETLDAEPPRALGDRENSADTPEAAVERELADGCRVRECAPRQLLRCREEGERDGQIESRALLAQLGRREVDRDTTGREGQLGGGDPAPDTLPGLLASPVGEPDDRETGDPVAYVGFDVDAAWLETDEGMRERACEHTSRLGAQC